MTADRTDLCDDGRPAFERLDAVATPDQPFVSGAAFWIDPYVSEQLLAAHLDPETEAASRPHDRIDAEVDWLVETLNLGAGDRLLDLGCGPGLYCERFHDRGLDVTGVDASATAIERARTRAAESGRDVDYRRADYRNLEFDVDADLGTFDAVVLVYFDFGTFDDADQRRVLATVRDHLHPDGRFAFDVRTERDWAAGDVGRDWSVATDGGFWRPEPHLVLSETAHYPEASVYLDQHLVLDEAGTVTPYRFWERYYDPSNVEQTLAEAGFAVGSVREDLRGTDYDEAASPSLGVVARLD